VFSPLIPGCNYHTKWQSTPGMRFVLKFIKGKRVWLATRNTGKFFEAKAKDLIFIRTKHNLKKARKILKEGKA